MDERHIGGLWCHEVLEHLDALVEGDLDDTTLAAVQAHVAECDACASFGAAYARLVRALRASPPEQLDTDRLGRLRARVREAS